MILRIQLEEAPTPCVLWHQLEGGYNPLSLPRPAAIKYKCRQLVTTIESNNLSHQSVTITCHINLYQQPVT